MAVDVGGAEVMVGRASVAVGRSSVEDGRAIVGVGGSEVSVAASRMDVAVSDGRGAIVAVALSTTGNVVGRGVGTIGDGEHPARIATNATPESHCLGIINSSRGLRQHKTTLPANSEAGIMK